MSRKLSVFLLLLLFLSQLSAQNLTPKKYGDSFIATPIAVFNEPWAMTFLPDGRLLVSEKGGKLLIVSQEGKKSKPIEGIPRVDYGGQGGLGDIILHPNFVLNSLVYISFVESGEGSTRGAAVLQANLLLDKDGSGSLTNKRVIWRQHPKTTGRGHYAHRLAFSPDGYLFITSGERQKFTPAQDKHQNLGKIIRLNYDGSIPKGNPFTKQGAVTRQIWTLGHRNPLGIAFDSKGKLWIHEMGPRGGDELNLIVRGRNYGYPIVSNGDHYDGRDIPDHHTRPEFEAPKITWTPVISPSGFIIYSAKLFPKWFGMGIIGGLSSKSLVLVAFDGDTASEIKRFYMGKRIREVEQGPDGAVWLLEDRAGGRLLKLTPVQ